MKFKITYEYDAVCPPHMFVVTEVKGQRIVRCGRSWEEARERMMRDLPGIVHGAYHGNVPPPESVEIP
jgi:hypothetical protein